MGVRRRFEVMPSRRTFLGGCVARIGLGLAILAAPALGCATGDGMNEKLRDATNGYHGAMRWGDIDRAAAWLPLESKQSFMASVEKAHEELVIVDYEITRLDLDKESGIAASRAEVQWHTDRRLVVESTRVDQLWQWHDGRFWLVDERRSGGKPLGLFAEHGEKGHPYLPGLEEYREANEIGEENKKKGRKGKERRAARKDRRAKKRGGESVASR